jgi:hypothetical protein
MDTMDTIGQCGLQKHFVKRKRELQKYFAKPIDFDAT